jgi:hypothetical protein
VKGEHMAESKKGKVKIIYIDEEENISDNLTDARDSLSDPDATIEVFVKVGDLKIETLVTHKGVVYNEDALKASAKEALAKLKLSSKKA